MIRKVATVAAISTCLLCLTLSAQDKKQKPWTEWSKKDVEKMLNDSPWGQTQTVTDTSEMFFSPTARPTASGASRNSASRDAQGATNEATDVKYRIRLFSARPIRQALARQLMLSMSAPNKDVEQRLKNFAELQSNESIIVTVTFESNDSRFGNAAMQSFNTATVASLKNSTYLERSDGKRVFLAEYVPPGKDGFGARFIFPRVVGERNFITGDAGEVRFASMLDKIELNMKFKVSKMNYNDALEY
ncbi:MAG: hypothetical protein ABR563_20085 [Pyrinomonadaceae bacterium]